MKLSKSNKFSISKRLKNTIIKNRGKFYGQRGEDIFLYSILRHELCIDEIIYIDIGCGDHKFLSNTWNFYSDGGRGYCFDASQSTCARFSKKRPNDIVKNVAVVPDSFLDDFIDFYNFDVKELNTSDKETKEYLVTNGFKLKAANRVKTLKINKLLKDVYLENKDIHFLNIDTEGYDFEILKSIKFDTFRPFSICIEVVDFNTGRESSWSKELVEFMIKNSYFLIINTGVNMIFVDRKNVRWSKIRQF